MAFICDGCMMEKRELISYPISTINGRYARHGKVEVDICTDCNHSIYGYKGQR